MTEVFVENDSAVAAGMDDLLAVRLSGPCTHSSRVIHAGATPLASSRGEGPRSERRSGALKRITKKERVHRSPLAVYRWTPFTPLLQSTAVHRSLPVYQSTTQSTVHRVHQESTGVHRVDGGLVIPQWGLLTAGGNGTGSWWVALVRPSSWDACRALSL